MIFPNMTEDVDIKRSYASDNNSESIDMLLTSNMKVVYSRLPDKDNPIDGYSFLSEIPDSIFQIED